MQNADTATELKYNIKQRLDGLPLRDRKSVFDKILQDLGVTDTHFRRIISYTKESKNEAKVSQLQKIADHFGCTVDDLLQR